MLVLTKDLPLFTLSVLQPPVASDWLCPSSKIRNIFDTPRWIKDFPWSLCTQLRITEIRTKLSNKLLRLYKVYLISWSRDQTQILPKGKTYRHYVYFVWISLIVKNWKYCNKIIFKYVNNVIRPSFKEKVVEWRYLWEKNAFAGKRVKHASQIEANNNKKEWKKNL